MGVLGNGLSTACEAESEDEARRISLARAARLPSRRIQRPWRIRTRRPASPFRPRSPPVTFIRPMSSTMISRPRIASASSIEASHRPRGESDRRQSLDHFHPSSYRRRTGSSTADAIHPPSPDEEPLSPGHFRARFSFAHSDDMHAFGISSSSDQIASGISESTSHPSFPSIISGASSVSVTADEYPSYLKELSHPSTIVSRSPRSVFGADEITDHFSSLNSEPAEEKSPADDDEAGYNGDGDLDSDSDDEGIEMGGVRRR